MVPVRNESKRLSSVNHTTKTIIIIMSACKMGGKSSREELVSHFPCCCERKPRQKKTEKQSFFCAFLLSELLFSFLICYFRSSHQWCSIRKVVLKNFAKFTGKYMCLSLHLYKVAGKRLRPKFFPVDFANFFRIPFLHGTSGQLLLVSCQCSVYFNFSAFTTALTRE